MAKLTKKLIEATTASPKDQIIFDDELPRFGVRIKPSGAKSYVLRYRVHGRSRSYTIAPCSVMVPDTARKRARELLGDIERGHDPAEVRQSKRNAPTVDMLAADYIERHAMPNKRERSRKADEAMLELHIRPALGKIKVADVSRRDIEKLHISLQDTPYQANRVLALLSKMFSLAVAWGWRADNPVRGVPKYQEEKRERWLDDKELAILMAALEEHSESASAAAIRFLILTGARRSEVLNAEWNQFDLERAVWIKSSHHTKQKKAHYVPLSPAALEVLHGRQIANQAQPSLFVFPGRGTDKPQQELKKFWNKILTETKLKNLRLHDLRHTYASHLVSSGVSLPIVGQLLGHTQSQTTHRYAHLADAPLRQATALMGNKFSQKGNPA
ncbi:MAG TPA: site-specific integrase [Rhodospirillaceae bacterium]|nr:MAG: hypothetical protein A2018_00640 [Alphaproteobacteria bacterium GWF2_58_20]HAU28672.1 site-specific integrase [Rhodospirillaceae bacterium]